MVARSCRPVRAAELRSATVEVVAMGVREAALLRRQREVEHRAARLKILRIPPTPRGLELELELVQRARLAWGLRMVVSAAEARVRVPAKGPAAPANCSELVERRAATVWAVRQARAERQVRAELRAARQELGSRVPAAAT